MPKLVQFIQFSLVQPSALHEATRMFHDLALALSLTLSRSHAHAHAYTHKTGANRFQRLAPTAQRAGRVRARESERVRTHATTQDTGAARPVMPMSTLPSLTYVAMSCAGRNTKVTCSTHSDARRARQWPRSANVVARHAGCKQGSEWQVAQAQARAVIAPERPCSGRCRRDRGACSRGRRHRRAA
jgi:hypothetical protein